MADVENSDFPEFLAERIAASDAYVNGDVAPLEGLATTTSPASIFPPNGKRIVGADEVNEFNAGGAQIFEPGSENAFEEDHSSVSGDLAYWVGVQRSTVRMKGQPDPIPMTLRLTEIYRREDGTWKLIHRHADQQQ